MGMQEMQYGIECPRGYACLNHYKLPCHASITVASCNHLFCILVHAVGHGFGAQRQGLHSRELSEALGGEGGAWEIGSRYRNSPPSRLKSQACDYHMTLFVKTWIFLVYCNLYT